MNKNEFAENALLLVHGILSNKKPKKNIEKGVGRNIRSLNHSDKPFLLGYYQSRFNFLTYLRYEICTAPGFIASLFIE